VKGGEVEEEVVERGTMEIVLSSVLRIGIYTSEHTPNLERGVHTSGSGQPIKKGFGGTHRSMSVFGFLKRSQNSCRSSPPFVRGLLDFRKKKPKAFGQKGGDTISIVFFKNCFVERRLDLQLPVFINTSLSTLKSIGCFLIVLNVGMEVLMDVLDMWLRVPPTW
jgi:hypothetical protein